MPNKFPAQVGEKPRLTTATLVAWLAAGLSPSRKNDPISFFAHLIDAVPVNSTRECFIRLEEVRAVVGLGDPRQTGDAHAARAGIGAVWDGQSEADPGD